MLSPAGKAGVRGAGGARCRGCTVPGVLFHIPSELCISAASPSPAVLTSSLVALVKATAASSVVDFVCSGTCLEHPTALSSGGCGGSPRRGFCPVRRRSGDDAAAPRGDNGG